ncbi:MAG: hypothetical protein Q9164_002871 [Protoblastenia rupestris]
MTVPKFSQLRTGLSVNVILKADQPTGKLTTGHIAGLLTRGDHPRGVKVRLSTGQIGRVQSLSSAAPIAEPSVGIQKEGEDFERSMGVQMARGQDRRERGRYKLQEDYRNDDVATDSRSLADYMKVSRKAAKGSKRATKLEDETVQAQLESEFPKLDAILIAAIVADHGSIIEARKVLSALS